MSGLLSARGQRMVELGGERAWLQRTKGDIVVSYQWMQIPGKKEPQPCMTMFPAVGKLDGGAYVIPQDNAYEYSDATGKPTPHLMVAAFNAAQSMGFFADRSTVFRIVDIIVDGLSDLVRMPSEQPGSMNIDRIVHGIEGTVRANGRVIHEEVI